MVQDKDQPQATVILNKYIAALGGAQRLNGLTSYIATGTSLGFGELAAPPTSPSSRNRPTSARR